MKNNITYPLTLKRLNEELSEIGLEAMVYRSTVEYDEHMVGADVYLTLECRVKDNRTGDDTVESSYERAMDILGH